MSRTANLIPAARQKRAAQIEDEHSRDLSLPCLACTGQGRLHSCEDFPLRDTLLARTYLTTDPRDWSRIADVRAECKVLQERKNVLEAALRTC